MMTVPMTQLEVPDYDLGLRGKLLRTEKTEPSADPTFCTIVHGLSLVDEVTDTAISNQANGYPDAALAVDESTRVDLSWRDGPTSSVIGDLTTYDGQPHPASARGQIQHLLDRYAELELLPVLGFEYEVWLFADTPRGAEPGVPLGRTENAYSLSRSREMHSLATEFVDRMEQIGAPIEAFHAELGPGFFEFTLNPQPALQAADGAARARQYFKDLCSEHGVRASFMAKPHADRSGAGGHVHSSLTRAGNNVFADPPGELSQLGRCYLAGLLETLGDFTALFNPFINSYKRIDKEMFVAEAATWGTDDRSMALRVLLNNVAGARVEHRRPGADASPYLVAAGLLAGGLVGLEQDLDLAEQQSDPSAVPPPADLGAAAARFEASGHAKSMFTEEFVRCYAATRRNEVSRYEHWLGTTVTEWELQRYGEHL